MLVNKNRILIKVTLNIPTGQLVLAAGQNIDNVVIGQWRQRYIYTGTRELLLVQMKLKTANSN